MNETRIGFRVFWSAEDMEWVGTSDAYPSLSHLAQTPEAAIRGIIDLQRSTAMDAGSPAQGRVPWHD